MTATVSTQASLLEGIEVRPLRLKDVDKVAVLLKEKVTNTLELEKRLRELALATPLQRIESFVVTTQEGSIIGYGQVVWYLTATKGYKARIEDIFLKWEGPKGAIMPKLIRRLVAVATSVGVTQVILATSDSMAMDTCEDEEFLPQQEILLIKCY